MTNNDDKGKFPLGEAIMQTQNKILDDISRVAGGALGAVSGVKTEVENMVRQQIERIIADLDLVPREEFEAVKAMAAEARARQEDLEKRLAELEGKTPAAPRAKPATRKPAAAKKPTK